MVVALEQELHLQRQYLENCSIETIYFGGGTPSLLNESELAQILVKIYSIFNVVPNVELTLEANPDDLDHIKLKNLRSLGFNRLSIGIQSFSNETLKFLNRVHTGREALECVNFARKAGFENISIDLIYGIAANGHQGWERDLQTVGDLLPEHISAYCLTIEPKTTFGAWMKKGLMNHVDDDYAAQQFEHLLCFLNDKGYEQYEISNFCQPGKYSLHNTNYWRQEKYLGIGPGAHSYNGNSRQFNVSHNNNYIKSIEIGVVPCEMDHLTTSDNINEYIMTSLRTRWGCDLNKIFKDYDVNIFQKNEEYINNIVLSGYGKYEANVLFLTTKGKLLADKIASDLFVNLI